MRGSAVQIRLGPQHFSVILDTVWAVSSVGRAHPSHGWGHRSESCTAHAGRSMPVVRTLRVRVDWVQFPAARPIKTFQIFRGKSLLARPAFGGSRFAKSPVFRNKIVR